MKNTKEVLPIEEVKPKKRTRKPKVEQPVEAVIQDTVDIKQVESIIENPLPQKDIKKGLFKQWCFVLMVILFCCQQGQINQLNKQVGNLSSLLSGVAPLILKNIELKDMNYYKENTLTNVKSTLDLWDIEDEYFIYFGREGCSYCEQAQKEFIIPFIQNNYTDNINIYFYEMVDNDFLYANDEQYEAGLILNPTPETFYILGTPTLLHIKDGVATTYIGLNEIPKALNPYQQ